MENELQRWRSIFGINQIIGTKERNQEGQEYAGHDEEKERRDQNTCETAHDKPGTNAFLL